MTGRAAAIVVFILMWTLAGCAESPGVAPGPKPVALQPAPAPPPETSLAQRIEEACRKLARPLLARVPAEKKLAVLPLVDSDGGQRRLGGLMAEGIEAQFAKHGRSLVDRTQLNELLAEIDLQLALTADAKTLQRAGLLSGADVLIVGRTIDTGSEVLLRARALDVTARAGHVLATTANVSMPRAKLGRLMWYVRRPAAAGATGELPPLALRYELVSPARGGEVCLGDGATVRSGQKFKIRVQPNSDCCLYVLLYDSRGAASVLFPHRKIGLSNRARGGVSYEIPEAAKWYWFDQSPGTETFYLVASYTPLKNLQGILARMREAGGGKMELAAAARNEIDTVVMRGTGAAGAADYRPRGYRIARRGVGGIVDLSWGPVEPAMGGRSTASWRASQPW